MNVNADLGEGAGADEAVLACVDSASLACGVHAGSISITIATARRCIAMGVEIGAHPGYDDRASFGRSPQALSVEDLEALVAFQVAGLAAIAPVAYVKPHGALYHRCQRDPAAADAVARVAARHGAGLLAQPGFEILAAAGRAGIPAYREGFADRLLLDDRTPAPRDETGAVLSPAAAARQAVLLALTGDYDSLCVHGDSEDASEIAAAVRAALRDAGIATAALRT